MVSFLERIPWKKLNYLFEEVSNWRQFLSKRWGCVSPLHSAVGPQLVLLPQFLWGHMYTSLVMSLVPFIHFGSYILSVFSSKSSVILWGVVLDINSPLGVGFLRILTFCILSAEATEIFICSQLLQEEPP